MSRHFLVRLMTLTAVVAMMTMVPPGLASEDTALPPETQIRVADTLQSAPIMFIENVGQFDDSARFRVYGGGHDLWLAEDALWITVLEPPPTPDAEHLLLLGEEAGPGGDESQPHQGVVSRLSFVDANPHPTIESFSRLDTHVSYFVGNDPAQWHPDAPVWGGVRYVDLYPGVDLELTSESGQYIQRLVAHNGADLSAVRLRVEGAEAVKLDGDRLCLTTAVGEYTLPLFQVTGAALSDLPSPAITGNQIASPFAESAIPTPQSTIVNPQSDVLLYATFLGGSDRDYGEAIAMDSGGAAYVTGTTCSVDFPTTPGAFDTTFNGGDYDAFVAKLAVGGEPDNFTDLGNAEDEAQHNLVGWGAAQGPPDNPLVSPSGDRTKRYQALRGDNSLDLLVDTVNVSYLLTAEVEDGWCTDNFEIYINGEGPLYQYEGLNAGTGPTNAMVHRVLVLAEYITQPKVTVTFRNTSTDNCGLAAVYNVGLFPLDGFFYSVTGHIRDGSDNPIPSVIVSAGTGGFATTDAGGIYTITNLITGTYTLTPSKSGWTFSPATRTISVPPSATGQDFTTSPLSIVQTLNFKVSFQSRDNTDNKPQNVPIKVKIKDLSGDQPLFESDWVSVTPADSSDNWGTASVDVSSAELTPGQTYRILVQGAMHLVKQVTIPLTDGLTIDYTDPALNPDGVLWACDVNQDNQVGDTDLGIVGSHFGGPAPTDPDPSSEVYRSDQNGDGEVDIFDLVICGSNYGKVGDGFYSVSGQVRDGSDDPIPGVTISAGTVVSATTDASGTYTITGLIAGTYTLTPSKSGYVFSPAARVVRVPPDASNQDFNVTPAYGTLEGRVTAQGSGEAIANARVSVGGKVGRTDANGNYTLTDILPGLHNVYGSADGYEDYKGEVTIEANVSTSKDVALEPISAGGYFLPYPGGKTYECTQGNGGKYSHQGKWYYAFDFGMPDGHGVVTAHDGRVVAVKENSNTSCGSKACISDANYVRIRHQDGTDTLYYHLEYQRVFVKKDEFVSRGQVIAESDTTGWCTGAHLDFTRHKWGQWNSIPVSFADVPGDGVPKTGKWYTSGNFLAAQAMRTSDIITDTEPPRGNAQLRFTGQPTHTLLLNASDYASDVTRMRLATTESDLQAANWVSFTLRATWTDPAVFAQYKDANGNISAVVSDTVDAIGYEPLQAAFTLSPTVCVGQGLSLTNQTTPFCEQCGWLWNFGDGTTSEEAEPPFDYAGVSSFAGYASLGTYTVTLTASNAVSVSSVSHQVEALAAPSADFTVIRSGATITVEAEATEAASWIWDFGDGITATGRTVTHTYTDTALLHTYPVRLMVTGNNSCTSLRHQYLSIHGLYLPLILRQSP